LHPLRGIGVGTNVRLVASYLNDATVTKISPGGDIGHYLENGTQLRGREVRHGRKNADTVLVAG